MTSETAIAHEEIRQLVARFTDAANRADYDLFRSVWVPDCTWEFKAPMAMVTHGVDETVNSLRKLLGQWEFFTHLVFDGTIAVSSDTAAGRWYIREMARSKDGKKFYQNIGLYEDELRRANGQWLFSRRTYHYIWLDDEAFGGRAIPLDYAAFPSLTER